MADQTAKLMFDAGMRLDPAERRLPAGMPLHAITSVHGEVGLRERLLIEIAQFPAADRDRAQDALALASRLHAGDRRQREPYGHRPRARFPMIAATTSWQWCRRCRRSAQPRTSSLWTCLTVSRFCRVAG